MHHGCQTPSVAQGLAASASGIVGERTAFPLLHDFISSSACGMTSCRSQHWLEGFSTCPRQSTRLYRSKQQLLARQDLSLMSGRVHHFTIPLSCVTTPSPTLPRTQLMLMACFSYHLPTVPKDQDYKCSSKLDVSPWCRSCRHLAAGGCAAPPLQLRAIPARQRIVRSRQG